MQHDYLLLLFDGKSKGFKPIRACRSEQEAILLAPRNRRFQTARIKSRHPDGSPTGWDILRNCTPFQVTDPDCGQKCRIHIFEDDGHREFEYEQTEDGKTKSDTINPGNMSEKEMEEAISGYYDSLEEVKLLYGRDWDQIVAECNFEKELDD